MLFGNDLVGIFVLIPVVVLSITLHEFAHALVAKWNGDYTAKFGGRLTLNPISHFDTVGFLMMLVVGFGYARPVPVNPNNFKNLKRGIITVAIAGIVTNLILAFIFTGFLTITTGIYINTSYASNAVLEIFHRFFSYMVLVNVSLALFNLLPLFPLDGFRVLEGFTRFVNPTVKFLRDYGQYILIGLIGLSIIVDYFEMPFFLDILGMYIGTLGSYIRLAFGAFWGLITGVVV